MDLMSTPKKLSPFDFINSINEGPRGKIILSAEDVESGYIPFMVNRGLSYFNETILLANEMNMRAPTATKGMQYNFLRSTVRPAKRFSKWLKRSPDDSDVEAIRSAYGYSRGKAHSVLGILTPDQIRVIRERYLQKGGIYK